MTCQHLCLLTRLCTFLHSMYRSYVCLNINTLLPTCKSPFHGCPTRVTIRLCLQSPSIYVTCHCTRGVPTGSGNKPQPSRETYTCHPSQISPFQASLLKKPTSIPNPVPTLPFSILEALSKISLCSKHPQDCGSHSSGDTV